MYEIISHRGKSNHGFPENTKEAILSVLNDKDIDGVEIDVRLTKDNKLIVFHDLILNIKTDGNGIVYLKKYNEIKKCKILNKYEIPLLDRLLKDIEKLKINKKIIIDVKHESININNIVSVLSNTLKKFRNLNIYICSFNEIIISRLKQKIPNKLGLIVGFGFNMNKFENEYDFTLIRNRNLENIDMNREYYIYGVNNKKEFLKLIDRFSCQNLRIISDKPYLFKDINVKS